jgi:hypothetical protein
LWIKWDGDVERRLGGAAPIDKRVVSVKRLCALEGNAAREVLRWASADGHEILRVRRGASFRFYILPSDQSADMSGRSTLTSRVAVDGGIDQWQSE